MPLRLRGDPRYIRRKWSDNAIKFAKKLGVILSKSEDVLRKEKKNPLDHWFYVSGIVENVFVMITGASKTLISEEVYKKIPEDTRPKLSPAASQRSVHNLSLQEYHKAVFESN